ncbi:hypothetical protein Hanom_Chr01g00087241 [Helianthus anomalus]
MGQGSKWAHCESLKVLTISLKGLKCNSCFSCYIRRERVGSSQFFEIFSRVFSQILFVLVHHLRRSQC